MSSVSGASSECGHGGTEPQRYAQRSQRTSLIWNALRVLCASVAVRSASACLCGNHGAADRAAHRLRASPAAATRSRPSLSKPTSPACSRARPRAESPPAALEALAITIRTYALANRDRHRADGFDLCDETHCQVVRDGDGRHRTCGAGDGRPGADAQRRRRPRCTTARRAADAPRSRPMSGPAPTIRRTCRRRTTTPARALPRGRRS